MCCAGEGLHVDRVVAAISGESRRSDVRAGDGELVPARTELDVNILDSLVADASLHAEIEDFGRGQFAGIRSRVAGVVDVQYIRFRPTVDIEPRTDAVHQSARKGRLAADVDDISAGAAQNVRLAADRLHVDRVVTKTRLQRRGRAGVRRFNGELARAISQHDLQVFHAAVRDARRHLQPVDAG